MATGVPNSSKKDKRNYQLSYDGKLDEGSILNGQRAELRHVFQSTKETPNMLIYGDNLPVLRTLLDDSNVAGKVDLIYIDPPYATGFGFESREQNHAYSDTLQGADFLEFLRQRLIVMRELLSPEGSIYVHLDSNMAFQAKLILDEIFGESNFRNWITRRKTNSKNYTSKSYGNVCDYILFYSKTKNYIWNKPSERISAELANSEYRHIDEKTGRRYMRVPVHAPGVRNGDTGKPWRGINPPPGKHWQYSPAKLDEMDARGEIYWSKNGNPRRKIFLDEHKGIGANDLWLDFKDAHNQNIKITGYPTEKNIDLIKRIVSASSLSKSLVLDAFLGSGTVADAAKQLDRNWIGIDNSFEAIKTTVKRMTHGTEKMGDYVKKESGKEQLSFKLPSKQNIDFNLLSHEKSELLKEIGLNLRVWESDLV